MKKISKKILSALLTLAMVVTLIPQDVFAAASMSTEEIDTAVETTVNAEAYFVLSATKKVITLNGVNNDGIDCNTSYNATNLPAKGKMKVYYGKGTTAVSKDQTVVNFTCDATNTSWGANSTKVYQIGKRTNPSGWESVKMEPQGDGTIAFRNNDNGNYISVQDEKLAIIKDSIPTANEKFIIYTKTAPKTAKKVTLSDVSGTEVNVSWEAVDECLYSGYQVLYSTSEDGKYTVAGETADTSFTVKNLKLNTKYYFKVRTVTNNEGGPYSDSEAAYATTLNDYKPSVPSGITIKQIDNSLVLDWKTSNSAKGYKVYKANGRFGEYKEVADVGYSTTYKDTNINASKYSNYYKVLAYNDVDQSKLSSPMSLEISMFGENTYIFSDTDNKQQMDQAIEQIYNIQHYNQFGKERYALAFKPGDYTKNSVTNIGYYTQILGLGKTPYDVKLNNVKTPAALSGNNATCNFWVGIENVTIKDLENNDDPYYSFQWAVSQAAPARRLYVERKAVFDWYYGWASGGFVADSYFAKSAGSFSQQQYYYRNCYINDGAYGVNWNQVIQGCEGNTVNTKTMQSLKSGIGHTNWATERTDALTPTTVIEKTDELREKPFLYFDTDADKYKVFVPALRKNSVGVSWSYENMGAGTSISVDKYFYIANPETDTAQTINAQLKLGKNIIFQPGIYHVSEPIKVTRSNTILLGLGIATIIPDNKETAIKISDVGGVSVAGLILDAGNYSDTLLTIGDEGANKDHSDNPVVLQDVIYRVGGTGDLGRTKSCLVINSNDVIIDHTWIWRADHGDHTGWNENTAKNGLIVNGDNVTTYGLFCEHFQEYDIIWRGEYGRTFFLQNEKCYDPQNQADWMSHDGKLKGYAAYKVTNNVKHHYAVGLGVYDVFINTNGASIYLDNAIEVPDSKDVLIENACIVEIASGTGPKVGINHIINNTTAGIRTGSGNNGGYAIQRLLSYNNNISLSLEDYYENEKGNDVSTEAGVKPTDDVAAEKDIVKNPPSKDDEKPAWEMTEDDYDKKLEEEENNNNNNNNNTNPPGNGGASDNVKVTLKKNQKFTVGKLTYKITKVRGKKGNISITGVKKKYRKNLKKITINSSVKYKGYTFNITSIGKKAFVNSKKLKKVTVKGKQLKTIAKNAFYKKVRNKLTIKAQKFVKKKILKSLNRKK